VAGVIGLSGRGLLFFLLLSVLFFESVHVHIPLKTPLGPGDMPQPSGRQHQGTVTVRKDPDPPRQPDHLTKGILNLGLIYLIALIGEKLSARPIKPAGHKYNFKTFFSICQPAKGTLKYSPK